MTSPRRHASKFKTHVKAHKTVVRHEGWFSDDPPIFGQQFTANKAVERAQTIVEILVRAAKREKKAGNTAQSTAYRDLGKKLKACRPGGRCGSLACPQCARAFQKAKVSAQEALICNLKRPREKHKLVMATIVPLNLRFKVQDLVNLDVAKRNRWLKDVLHRANLDRVMFGSADISWENGGGFYQLHWHIGMWTRNPKKLTTKLKKLFPGKDPYDRPVVVSATHDLNFLGYKNKGIKLPELLRSNRTYLPELLLVLDRTEPLDLMILMKLRLSTQAKGLLLNRIRN
jgi:hypothetical protein